MSSYEKILYHVEGRIAHITLNVPEKRNALSLAMRSEIVDALKTAERDDDVTVILLQGAGPVFCSGFDLAGGSVRNEPRISESISTNGAISLRAMRSRTG